MARGQTLCAGCALRLFAPPQPDGHRRLPAQSPEQCATTFDATLPLLARLPEGIADWRRLARENEITRHTLQNTTSHSGTLFLRYTADRWFSSVNLTLKHESETYDFEKGGFPAQHLTRRQTLPSFSTQTEWKPGSSKFTFYYDLRTSAPFITEQITLPDLADPRNVRLSNPDLKTRSRTASR